MLREDRARGTAAARRDERRDLDFTRTFIDAPERLLDRPAGPGYSCGVVLVKASNAYASIPINDKYQNYTDSIVPVCTK